MELCKGWEKAVCHIDKHAQIEYYGFPVQFSMQILERLERSLRIKILILIIS